LPDAADGLVLIAVPRTETLLRVRVIDKSTTLMPALIEPPSDRQRAFLRYYTGTLIDLVILGLFNEFSDKVWV